MTEGRPLSPFLHVIYNMPVTSLLSITHRATGIFLFIGLMFFSWFCILSTLAPDSGIYLCINAIVDSMFGKVVYFCWCASFFYHCLNGIRHLLWDLGIGFEKSVATLTGIVVVVISISLAIIASVLIFWR